jgi:hypothetical protein
MPNPSFTRRATAGFARLRTRVNSNVERLLSATLTFASRVGCATSIP